MAESIEEIAALIQSLKMDNELSNEDFNKILLDIRSKVSELHDYNEAAEVAAAIQRTIDEKSLVDNEKIRELDSNLRQLRIKLDSSSDLAELVDQVRTLADNFKSGFNSVVSFANKDADAKNLLLDRMEDLEKAVKNGAMVESIRQRTDDLVRGYENFISDSNLRHGNMVSALVDLKNKIDDYSSKNNYVFGTIDHSITDASDKLTNLESAISSNLGNVNSKLYSMGDDIQKILNDGFDHLKYLSSNMSEAMNSSSLDVKTTLEVLKANISDYTEHLRDEFGSLTDNISSKIENSNNVSSIINNDILNSVKEVENVIAEKSDNYESVLNEKVNNLTDFIRALQETVDVFKTENNAFLSEKLSELNNKLQEVNNGYERLLAMTSEELRNVSDSVSQTSDNIVSKLQETDIEEIYVVKNELLSSSASNLNAIIEKIQGITDSVESFKENTAVNLSNYLTAIKDLFNDFSSKTAIHTNDTEVLEKLSNLEILMSRMDIEKNDNFSQLHSLLQKNSEKLESLGNLKNIIEEHSNAKDEKLNNIEALMNKFDSEKNSNFSQIQSMLQHNTDTIANLGDIKAFIEEHSNDKSEKLNAISNLISKFDTEKNDNFAQLKDLLGENTRAIESLNVRTGTDLGLEKLECLLREDNEDRDQKLDTLKSLVYEYKESVGKLTENIQLHSEKETNELAELKSIVNDVLPKQSALNELSELINNKVFEYKTALSDEITSVKDSVTAISSELSGISPKFDDSAITLKLSELNNQLSETSQSYEHALSLLSSRLDQYVESAENISLATNTKFENTSKEFEGVHERFENLSEQLNNLVGDSGLIEILANIRQQFNVVSEQLKAEKDGIISGVEDSLNDNINGISTAIIQLHQGIDEIHEKQLENFGGIIFNLEGIRGDVNAIVANIEKNLTDQVSTLTSEFKPLEEAITSLIEKNYAQSVEEIKQQIELSYVTLRSQLGEDIGGNNTFSKIEELYKSSANKFTNLEELFKSTVLDNIESINSVLVNIQALTQSNISGLENAQNAFQEDLINLNNKITESQTEVKTSILQELKDLKDFIAKNKEIAGEDLKNALLPMFDNDEIFNTIRGINKSLADKITEFKQDSDLAAQNIIEVANSSKNTIDYILEVINNKFEKAGNNASKIIENIETLSAKLDVIAMAIDNSEVINAIADVDDKLNNIGEEYSKAHNDSNDMELKSIMAKLDGIASLTDNDEYALDIDEIKLNLENLNKRFESFNQIELLTNALNDKIDILTSDNSSENIESELAKIQKTADNIAAEINSAYNPEELLYTISNKLDVIAKQDGNNINSYIETINSDLSVLKDNLNSTETKLENYLRAMDSTLDVLTSAHEDNQLISRNIEEVRDDIATLNNNIHNIDSKLDILANTDNSDILVETDEIKTSIDELSQKVSAVIKKSEDDTDDLKSKKLNKIEDYTEQIKTLTNTIDNKLDIVAQSDNEDVLTEIEQLKEQITNTESNLEGYSRSLDCKLDEISQFTSVNELINKLNSKVDILAMSDDSDVIDEIYGIKQLVEEQLETLKNSVEDTTQAQKLMDALNKIDNSIVELDFSKQASEIKEAVITALVSVTNEISFVEEADDIKDYVGQRTNELHRLLMDVKHQLFAITNTTDDMDMYSYTLQDVESDLAKLRLVVNEFADKKSDNELTVISTNLNKMAKAMTDLRDAVVDAEVKRSAKNDIGEVNDQVVSMSSRLNKILLSRHEVDNQILDKLAENQALISTIDTKDFRNKFDKAMEENDKRLEYMTNIVTVLRNSMMYLGEWMDGTTETLSSISDRCYVSDELNQIKAVLPNKDEIVSTINKNSSEQLDLINSQNEKLSEQIEINRNLTDSLSEQKEKFIQIETDIDNLQNIVENTISQNDLKAEELQTVLENRISKQEKRLDRIEKTLDKIITIMEASGSNFETMDRIDKLDEKVSKLNSSIEKLAAYVE